MREIDRSRRFEKDYKREKKNPLHKQLDLLLAGVLANLIDDFHLSPKYRDHALTGNYAGYRDCHLKADLLLIYQKIDFDVLYFSRLGSHAELFD
ncbi:MAG: hypothetical protein RLZZ330_656 [Actinomycetota bacterium]